MSTSESQKGIGRLREHRALGLFVFTLILAILVSIKEPTFLSATNMKSIVLWVSVLLVMGAGQMLAVVTRGIDVSVGSIMGLSAMVMGVALLRFDGLSVWLAVAIALGSGGLLGLVNGGLIAGLKIPPIIVTLGTLSVYRGLCFVVADGRQIDSTEIPESLVNLSAKGLGGISAIPMVIVIPVLTLFAVWFFLNHTRTGRSIYAIGSNPDAAVLLGLPVSRILLLVYVLGGVLAGLGGVLYASRYAVINPGNCGYGYELTVIAATVIGGIQIRGGVGTVSGLIAGGLLLAVINVSMAVVGVAGAWQLAIYGSIILLAVVSEGFFARGQESRS